MARLSIMFIVSVLTLGLSSAAFCSEPSLGWVSDSLDRLYQGGRTYSEFLEAAKARRETWLDNTKSATVDSSLLARARAVPGEWRLLIVAEDWCGDSANTIPYVARLVESLPAVALRIVGSAEGRWVMERYRTPDDRAATPTIVLLDQAGEPVGCFVERPAALRDALAAESGRRRERVLVEWRRKDAGRSTMQEMVGLLETASLGSGRCTRSGPS